MPRACALQAGILDGAPEFVDPEYPAQDEKPVTTSASSRSLAHTKARGTRVCRLGSITQGAPTCDSFGGACSFEPLQPMVGACALDALFPTRECEWVSGPAGATLLFPPIRTCPRAFCAPACACLCAPDAPGCPTGTAASACLCAPAPLRPCTKPWTLAGRSSREGGTSGCGQPKLLLPRRQHHALFVGAEKRLVYRVRTMVG